MNVVNTGRSHTLGVVAATTTPRPRLCTIRNFTGETLREGDVRMSVLEAIRDGVWDYEPKDVEATQYSATRAMPGTRAKLDMLAERAAKGLPLWHEEDRITYDDGNDNPKT